MFNICFKRDDEMKNNRRKLSMVLLSACAALVSITFFHSCTSQQSLAEKNTYLRDISQRLKQQWPDRPVNIVCHGHSVPAGYFKDGIVNTFQAYPYLLHKGLKERFPCAIINVIVTAKRGETSDRGAQRFVRDVLLHKPDVVIIDYALNDWQIGLMKSRAALISMISKAKVRGIKVILLTPTATMKANLDNPEDPLNKHAQQIRDLAKQYGVGLVDSLEAFQHYVKGGGRLRNIMSSLEHPNRKGHALVAERLLEWFPE
jgi:acyl-CoA thioesterase-1